MPLPIENPGLPFNTDFNRLWYRDYVSQYGAALGVFTDLGAPAIAVAFDGDRYNFVWGASAAGAAKWMGEGIQNGVQGDDAFASDGSVEGPSSFLNCTTIIEGTFHIPAGNVVDNNSRIGLSLGHSSKISMEAAPVRPIIALYAALAAPQWELFVSTGVGNVIQKRVLSGVQPPVADFTYHMRMVYVPGQFVAGFISGKEGGRIVDQSKFPDRMINEQMGPMVFIQSGLAGAAGQAIMTGGPRAYHYGK